MTEIEAALERIRQVIADAAIRDCHTVTVSLHDLCVVLALAEMKVGGDEGGLIDALRRGEG